ncbi:hypothetical protein PCANC_22903 [Puccinia coronata f. sp. avenae]|uniref:Uncharacterized protein n=1 Tax=Puccinia coronata f. sp. avenae TaxID=200324 RepID=A0A2N5TLG3_9BASI|nr:hypothetical protein PCANC_22903 [Puccinia coronata f. sp. avenae]
METNNQEHIKKQNRSCIGQTGLASTKDVFASVKNGIMSDQAEVLSSGTGVASSDPGVDAGAGIESTINLPAADTSSHWADDSDSSDVRSAMVDVTSARRYIGCLNRLPQDSLRKDLIDIHPTAASFKSMLDKAKNHAQRCMDDAFQYSKERWDKKHKLPTFKIGTFVIQALHGDNAVEVELSGELEKKHPTFP